MITCVQQARPWPRACDVQLVLCPLEVVGAVVLERDPVLRKGEVRPGDMRPGCIDDDESQSGSGSPALARANRSIVSGAESLPTRTRASASRALRTPRVRLRAWVTSDSSSIDASASCFALKLRWFR
jgi:hypothetical protein